MRKMAVIIALALTSTSLVGQAHLAWIGLGIGSAPYEGGKGLNFELQYELAFLPTTSLFSSLGTTGYTYTATGQSKGGAGMETWDNKWKYTYNERFHYIDLGLKHRIFRIGQKYEFKALAGASFAHSVFTYPETIFINRGVIVLQDNTTHRANVAMLLLGISQQMHVSERFWVGLSACLRTTMEQKYVLTRVVRYDIAISSATSGILNVFNINLQAGYSF